MSITLPPMPVPTLVADSPAGHTAAYSPAQLRARDIEVAMSVLDAAVARVKSRFDYEATAMAHYIGTWHDASQYHADRMMAASHMLEVLRELEVSHE